MTELSTSVHFLSHRQAQVSQFPFPSSRLFQHDEHVHPADHEHYHPHTTATDNGVSMVCMCAPNMTQLSRRPSRLCVLAKP